MESHVEKIFFFLLCALLYVCVRARVSVLCNKLAHNYLLGLYKRYLIKFNVIVPLVIDLF